MSEHDPELEAWLREHPELAGRADELESVRAELERWGAGERERILAEARAMPAGAAEDRVTAALRLAMAGGGRRRERTWLPALVVAAAVVLVLVGYRLLFPPTVEIPEGYHVGGEIPLVQPVGTVPEWGPFTWRYELPAEGWFEIEVWNVEVGGSLTRALPVIEEWTETTWTPNAEKRAALGELIQWQVRAFDATGRRIDYGTARARRSP